MQHEKDMVPALRSWGPERHRWVKVVDVPGGQFDLCLPGSCRCQGEGLAEGVKAEGRKGGMEKEAGPGARRPKHGTEGRCAWFPQEAVPQNLGSWATPGRALGATSLARLQPSSLLSRGREVLPGL